MTILDPHLDVDQLSAAVDGTDDPAVTAHLVACLACRAQVEAWRRTLAPLRSLPVPPPGADPVLAALAAWPPASFDAPSADVGRVPPVDGVSPARVDAGPPAPVDRVPPAQVDAGPVQEDVGPPAPFEAVPSARVDARPVDAGPVDSGSAADVGPVGAGPVDGVRPASGVLRGEELRRAALAEAEAELRRGRAAPRRRPGAPPAPGGPGRRQHLDARLRRLRPPTGVTAALVLLVLLAGAVVGIRSSGHGSTSASSAKSSSAPTSVQAPRSAASSGAAAAPGLQSGRTAAPAPSYARTGQLAAQLRQVVTARPDTAVPAGSPCLSEARRLAAHDPGVGTTPSYTEAVTLAGVAGQVFVFGQTHGHVAVVVRSATCALLATVSF